MCGENVDQKAAGVIASGSPPRVRGKLERVEVLQAVVRITPACAGKTKVDLERRADEGDHPRVCGENLWFYES